MITRRALFALVPAAALMPQAALAKTDPVYSSWGVAVDGSDVVAYFKEGKPVKGKRSISHEWNGATWRFASEANRDAFAADPEAYAPQYGGYCAYAVSEGYTASTVPEAWKIVDGKLYLNYSLDVQGLWAQDVPGRISRADANWPKVLE